MALRKKIKDGLSWVGSRFTANSAILLYHRVDAKDRDPFNLCVAPENFERQMEVLADLGTALPLGEFVARQKAGQLEPGSICVTFDDGYLDVFENALPIMEKYGIPSTVFVVSGNLGKAFWWDRLIELIQGAAGGIPASLRLSGVEDTIETGGLSEKHLMKRLYPVFRSMEPQARWGALDELADALNKNGDAEPGPRCASPDELRRVSCHPLVTIGAHTVTHSQLSSLPVSDQAIEIESSLQTLSEVIGSPVNSFSYPFGLRARDYTEETVNAVREASLDHALAADLNVVNEQSDLFTLPRLWIHDRDGDRFGRQLKRWLGAASSPVTKGATA